jgi:3,4-dihydroxy 2-butanone 4-phosphate synthase/GTP cyclohydrolase II
VSDADDLRIDPIERAIADIAAGRPVVVLDAADREDEGDLVMAASAMTDQWMAMFVRHGSGFVCVPMPAGRADRLGLPLMVARGEEALGTAFTVTVDAREGVSTGISAADRCLTVRLLASPDAVETDFVRPGHVLPLRAHHDGVRARAGHTEAAVDLARLAGAGDVGVIVELVDDDGSMRRADSCRAFADEHGLALVTIADLRAHLGGGTARAQSPDRLIRRASTRLPTSAGVFTAHGYRDASGFEHVALVVGDVTVAGGTAPVAVRVHSECLTGDVLGSLRCDCGPQLRAAMEAVQREGRGVVIHLRGHEGRGIGLTAKLAAYALQDTGRDTVEANLDLGLPVDSRDYSMAARILDDLQVESVRLLTNNPEKVHGLRHYGIEVPQRQGVVIPATSENVGYLDTKRRRLGHDLPVADLANERTVR